MKIAKKINKSEVIGEAAWVSNRNVIKTKILSEPLLISADVKNP